MLHLYVRLSDVVNDVCLFGRDERPPQILTPGAGAPSLASQRWVPPNISGGKRDGYNCEDRQDAIFRKVRGWVYFW